jgi:hypothetical protein
VTDLASHSRKSDKNGRIMLFAAFIPCAPPKHRRTLHTPTPAEVVHVYSGTPPEPVKLHICTPNNYHHAGMPEYYARTGLDPDDDLILIFPISTSNSYMICYLLLVVLCWSTLYLICHAKRNTVTHAGPQAMHQCIRSTP